MAIPAHHPYSDVVVYGATSAGVIAAIQAARRKHSVVLIEPSQHLGGMTTSGLGMTDHGRTANIGGLSREFYQRIRRHYENPASWHREKPDLSGGDAMFTFEPRVARQVFEAMLAEQQIRVVTGERLDLTPGSVEKVGGRIRSIRMESARIFSGRIFIDATYEGDLMALAGISFHVGREGNSAYDEQLNGVQTARAVSHQFQTDVDPYVEAGNPNSGLLPGIDAGPPEADGQGDARIQAFCYRLCLTDDPENRVPFPKPSDYDPLHYELLLRSLHAGANREGWMNRTKLPFTQCRMPNGKTDSNNVGPVSFDFIGMNYLYPEGDYKIREAITQAHRSYQMGLLWFLTHDQRVPEATRDAMSRWGLPSDEFVENGHWPPQLYVREARRMIGDNVMTEHHCVRNVLVPDPVGIGSYAMDSHHVRRYVTQGGTVRNEGDVQVNPGGPYPISYRSLVPKRCECTNLLVPVCISSAHIAFGSIRMEPVFMILGHSAATAASLALEENLDVQDVDYLMLHQELLGENQSLAVPANLENETELGNPVQKTH